jgi:hypothetical protein
MNPIYPCIGVKLIDNTTNATNLVNRKSNLSNNTRDSIAQKAYLDHIRDNLWNIFLNTTPIVTKKSFK